MTRAIKAALLLTAFALLAGCSNEDATAFANAYYWQQTTPQPAYYPTSYNAPSVEMSTFHFPNPGGSLQR